MKTVKNPQANAPTERINQVVLNIIVTKDLHKNVFNHIDPWGETLAYIAWEMRTFYNHTIMAAREQAVFGRGMLFKLTSITDWLVVTTVEQSQVYIDNVRENDRKVTHDYAIGNQVYVEMNGIYRKLDYRKQGPYRINEVF